jgi:type VI secretion system secreted protein Hcp
MSMPLNNSGSARNAGADVFLHVQTKRAGKIKGEVSTSDHADDIQVHGWTWGAAAGSAIGATAATVRRQYKHLLITKAIDSASTGLLSALATNDEVKEAKLCMRKAGGEALDYYTMTLNNARVVAVDVNVDAEGHPVETVAFSFTKIEIEYKRQDSAGISAGAFTFNDDAVTSP